METVINATGEAEVHSTVGIIFNQSLYSILDIFIRQKWQTCHTQEVFSAAIITFH